MSLFRFHRTSALIALLLLALEIAIALFAHDGFVRPFLGDVLVIMLLFFTVRAMWHVRSLPAVVGVQCFAVLVEAMQAFHLIDRLGWSHSTLAELLLGNTFSWADLLAYFIGGIASLCIAADLPGAQKAG